MIERVFENLIENAIRFAAPVKGRVDITLRRAGDAVVVLVTDTGTGIDAKDLPFIFERFYRSKDAQRHDGSGLGLAIVHRILQLHNVEIDVESELGAGATFRVRLPAAGDARLS